MYVILQIKDRYHCIIRNLPHSLDQSESVQTTEYVCNPNHNGPVSDRCFSICANCPLHIPSISISCLSVLCVAIVTRESLSIVSPAFSTLSRRILLPSAQTPLRRRPLGTSGAHHFRLVSPPGGRMVTWPTT